MISEIAAAKWLPWAIVGALALAGCAGTGGLYFGYRYATNELTAKAEADHAQLVQAYDKALAEKEARRKDAEDRGRTIEGDFLSSLQSMKVVNKTYYNEVQKETEKLVYTDCKIPDSGVDLVNKHIDETNAIFLGKVVNP